METKFKKGDMVSFNRNSVIKSEGTEIIAVVVNNISKDTKEGEEIPTTYIVENENGWVPNYLRQSKFGLNTNKKYLFVNEDELKLV